MFYLSINRVMKATLLVAALSGAAISAQAQPMGGHGAGHGPGMMMGGGPRIEHILEAVDASDAQRAQVQQIVRAAMVDLKAQRQAGRQLHQQGLALFGAPLVDASAVEALRVQMLANHDQVSRRTSQMLIEVSRVLTPEQRAKFVARMQKRQARMAEHMRGASAPARGN